MNRFKNRFYRKLRLDKVTKEVMKAFKIIKREMLKDCKKREAGK